VFGITGRALPAPNVAPQLNMTDRELHRHVIEHAEPFTWDRINQQVDQIAQSARANNVSIDEAMRVAREGGYTQNGMRGLSIYERQHIARDVRNIMQAMLPPNEAPQDQALEQRWRNEIFTGDLTERQALTRLNSILSNTNLSVENILALGNVVNDPDSPQFRFADDARMDMYNARINDAIAQRVISNLTARDRELYSALSDVIDNAIEEGAPLPDPTDGEAYAQLILDDEIGGELTELTDVDRHRLAAIVRRYGADATLPPQGRKDGGRIRKYESGGSIAEEANKQLRETRQPEPRPDPATGRFPSPDISRMPERTMVMPRYMHLDKDYPAVGARLSANKRLDNNSMVTGYIDADTTKAPGEKASTRASGVGVQFLHSFAKGGTVRTIPSVDQMQYELMMRRK
jgi:hypothetical protein